MWLQLLLLFAPDLETLLNGVIGAASKTQDKSRAAAGQLAGQAAELQRQSDAHLAKANQAADVISKLSSVLG